MKTVSQFFPTRLVLATGLVLVIGLGIHPAFSAESFQGANAILEKVEKQSTTEVGKKEKGDESSQLRTDLQTFQKKLASLSETDAANGWLELVDRLAKLPKNTRMNYNSLTAPVGAQELLGALPPPRAWDELAKAIAQRPEAKGEKEMREIGLRLLAATLTRNDDAWKSEIAALQAKGESADPQMIYFFRQIFEQLSEAMLSRLDDADAVLKVLERRLDGMKERGYQTLRIPNLVSLIGKEKAETFLRRALLHHFAVLEIDGANDTSRLAQKLAIELIDQLKNPQWNLVNSLDSIELYEALEKRFAKEKEKSSASLPGLPDIDFAIPEDPFDDYTQHNAQAYYMLGLISHDRAKDAVAVAKKLGKQGDVYLPVEAFKAMERAGYTKSLDKFFYELLTQDPTLSFWDEYVELAAKAGQTERMLKLARATASREDLSKKKKAAIYGTLFRALLAADQIDEGVKEMRQLMAVGKKPEQWGREESPGQLGIMLARLGILLQKPEWIEEGIRAAQGSLKDDESQSNLGMGDSTANSLATLLQELKRGAVAEAVLSDALSKMVRQNRTPVNPSGMVNSRSSAQLLSALAALYHKEGRHADVLILLDQSPDWGVKDIADLFQSSSYLDYSYVSYLKSSSKSLPLPYFAASALASAGRNDEAKKIINALLDQTPGLDAAYELLLSIEGEKAIARLDELFARDQFEERPLIWKAHLLRQQNKLEEAEKIVRQAISIDPSDGEQGPGDRMRAYSVLADIREARGDKKEADFFRGAVKAIRLSEDADKYYSAGLLKRAVKMYEQSLTLFSDAYCIQSRLAIQLASMGLHEEAEEHYRRAYELMPDSFGRVESHCFGCERAFEGQRAQSLAEKIFIEFAQKTPGKPQVHYLLGYLRDEQERHSEAMGHFKTAVKLDPDYLNAWIKIQSGSEHVHLPSKDRDQIVFNIIRLDPLRRHGGGANFSHVADLAGLWNAVESSSVRQPVKPTTLYPLAASKPVVEKQENDPAQKRSMFYSHYSRSQNDDKFSPAKAVGQTAFVQVAAQLFGGTGMTDDE